MKAIVSIGAALGLALLVQGCAVQKTLAPVGGSRTDGTVRLAYEFQSWEVPQIDMQQGAAAAAQRCATWGYSGAEPFGGQTRVCNDRSKDGCTSWLVTVEFQCTGTPTASK